MTFLPRRTLSAGAILRWHTIRRWMTHLLPTDPGCRRVLDVGCGHGEYVLDIARSLGPAGLVVGLDKQGRDDLTGFFLPPPALAEAVHLVHGEFSPDLVRHLGPFNAVLCVDVLEHVPNDVDFVNGLVQVTVPGARLLLHVPSTPQWHPLPSVRRQMERLLHDGTGQHVREGYSRRGVVSLLQRGGWRVVRARATFGRLAAIWCDVDYWLAARGHRLLRAMALPATVALAAAMARHECKTGNGWLVLAER